MAFLSFKAEGRSSYGIARENGVFDLGLRIGNVLPDLKSYLAANGLGLADKLPAANSTDYAAGEFDYLPVIPNSNKILCVGLNYEEHRKETGRSESKYPSIFTRFADTLTGHNTTILLPPNSTDLDFEGELAVVIGRSCFRVDENHAMSYVAGYSVFNDATLRDWQRHTHQFIPGKNFPDTGAFGPALITQDEAGSLAEKKIGTKLNGATMQTAQLGDMIFSIAKMIAYVSGFTRLTPGDVIATGTPGGVGFKRDPAVYMRQGDRIEVSIDGIGTLSNTIGSAPRTNPQPN